MSITAGTGTAEHMNMAERGKCVLVEWPPRSRVLTPPYVM